jgi:hypothetical protein
MADDPLSQLERFSWRGIKVPLTARQWTLESPSIRHSVQFRDGELIEGTGTTNLTFRYSLPMREGVGKIGGAYKELYSRVLPAFFAACQDRTEGPLIDPGFGELNAKFERMTGTTSPLQRDGEDIEVEFIHAPELADELPQALISVASTVEAAAQLAIILPDLPDPDIGLDILQLIGQIQGQADLFVSRLDGVAAKLEAVEAQLVELADPTEWKAIKDVRALDSRVRDLAVRAATRPGRELVQLVTGGPQTIAGVAASTGMNPKELLDLNPALARSPTVPPSTTIRYYKDAA